MHARRTFDVISRRYSKYQGGNDDIRLTSLLHRECGLLLLDNDQIFLDQSVTCYIE